MPHDSVTGFESRADVVRFLEALKERFAKFGLTLNEEKTRVLEFGRRELCAAECQGVWN